MLFKYNLSTANEEFINITEQVRQAVKQSAIKTGLCIIYCPHTTAGMTINENADPAVVNDMLFALEKTFPNRQEFRHIEGNSSAHIKASVIGSSVSVIIEDGCLLLGMWQGIYFTEFDGPRNRKFYIKIIID